MAFSEFYCDPVNGSNSNGGSDAGSPSLTDATGAWISATNTLTTTSSTAGVTAGQYCNLNNGAYIARVVTVNPTTLVLSATAFSGTKPGDGTYNSVVGGAFKGPNGASGFPLNFITNAAVNTSGDFPRVNYKNNATYAITAAISGIGADTRHQGYSSTVADGGKAIIDGGTSGASYNLVGSTVGNNAILADFICQNNGATGSASGVFWNSSGGQCFRVVCHDVRGHGFQTNNGGTKFVACEAYAFNQSNTANLSGFNLAGAGLCILCIAHDASGSNCLGYMITSAGATAMYCIADTCGARGFEIQANSDITGCVAYNCTSDGIRLALGANTATFIMNCILVKNGGYGIAGTAAGTKTGVILNCAFGAGTEANTSGQTNAIGMIDVIGSVTLPTNTSPFTDAANGDFRSAISAIKGAGFGSFVQVAAGYAGTVGYPDIGAVQHLDSGGSTNLLVRRGFDGGFA